MGSAGGGEVVPVMGRWWWFVKIVGGLLYASVSGRWECRWWGGGAGDGECRWWGGGAGDGEVVPVMGRSVFIPDKSRATFPGDMSPGIIDNLSFS
ncbi:hypothetical protein Tco_1566245 [Tanacetum coccineum]